MHRTRNLKKTHFLWLFLITKLFCGRSMHFINDILWAEKPQSVTCTLDMLSHMKPSVTVTIETKTAMEIAGWGREGRTPFPYFSPFSFSTKWTARVSPSERDALIFFPWSRSSLSLSPSLSLSLSLWRTHTHSNLANKEEGTHMPCSSVIFSPLLKKKGEKRYPENGPRRHSSFFVLEGNERGEGPILHMRTTTSTWMSRDPLFSYWRSIIKESRLFLSRKKKFLSNYKF